MRKITCLWKSAPVFLMGALSWFEPLHAAQQPPNVVYILADDLGYGDLGAYGQQVIQTPNIDKLSNDGMTFSQHYSGSAVCAPARCVLLTGKHTGHSSIRGNAEIHPEGQQAMPASDFTLAELFKRAGYTTGAFGKWGLGFVGTEGDPLQQGFDRFYGYNCQRMAHRYYPPYLWDDDQRDFLKGNDTFSTVTYAPDVIQEKMLDFVRQHRDEPFFLYFAATFPHAELLVPEDAPDFRRYKKMFGKDPFDGPDWRPKNEAPYGPDWTPEAYAPQDYPQAAYAVMVEMLDRQVGELISLLESLGLSENTLIVFSSDNGPHDEGGIDPRDFHSNASFRGMKRDLYEGGIRVPFIAKWPDHIPAGTSSDYPCAFWDMMPTFADLLELPLTEDCDGISLLPVLEGRETPTPNRYLYWEFHEQGGKQAVRFGDWKAVRLNVAKDPGAPIELYNLSDDPGETDNLAEQYPDIVSIARDCMKSSHTRNELFKYPWEQ